MNYRKEIMLGTLEAWSMSRLSQRPSKPAYYIEDFWIYRYILCLNPTEKQIFRNAKVCAKKAFYTVHSARATYSLTPMGGVLSALCNAITTTRIVSNSAIASVNKCSESFENSLLKFS